MAIQVIKLTIELVPSTSWYNNVRKNVSKSVWDRIRRTQYRKANYKCEICNGSGPEWPVECHEIWEYDKVSSIQLLTGFIALCPDCHLVKHIGYANVQGKYMEALEHLMLINKWDLQKANDYIEDAFDLWQERSKHGWTVNISFLEDYK